MTAGNTPTARGYRLAAQWGPHRVTWLGWPGPDDGPGDPELAAGASAAIARGIAALEPVCVLAAGPFGAAQARRLLGGVPNCHIHEVPAARWRIRDRGVTFLGHDQDFPPALVSWGTSDVSAAAPFGEETLAQSVARLYGRLVFTAPLEIGPAAVDGNGRGTILASAPRLLDPAGRPGPTAAETERVLAEFLAARCVCWLDGPAGATIDQLARFVDAATVVVAVERDRAQPHYRALAANRQRLRDATDQAGRPLRVVAIPLPRATPAGGSGLPASYLSFYATDKLVLVPQFDDTADWDALETFSRVFSDQQVRGLPMRPLAEAGGSIFSMALDEPATPK
jgi:agmatine deiminase